MPSSWPPWAWADLPVASDADYNTLKKNLLFGDRLAFELYETVDCTGAPVYSEILGAGTPEVTIEQVKPVPAKKQKPKLRISLMVNACFAPS